MDLKDGLYKINSKNTPFINYLVVKTYGTEKKRRYMSCVSDICQQVLEWDQDYQKENPDDKSFKTGIPNTKIRKNYETGYQKSLKVLKKDDTVVFEGQPKEIASKFNCSVSTVYRAEKNNKDFLGSMSIVIA